ncbi:MAG TPA: hypothetical protein PKE12_00420 [Kiritimatiellia bacterium]|nr:hypothetical protein [Kiritimatiellia bacterium]
MHPTLSAWLSARLVDRAQGHRARVLEGYHRRVASDYLSAEVRAERQAEALATLLRHAGTRVPRFRQLMADGPVPAPGNARDWLERLPPMNRADIQSDPASFISDRCSGTVDDHTGGSTGTPLTFKVDRPTQQARESSLMWGNHLAGWRPGQRIAMLWGSDRDTKAAFHDWRLNLRWWLDNMRWYNAFRMGDAEMAAFHKAMTRFKPHLLVAYAGSLDVYARFVESIPHRESLQASARSESRLAYPLGALVSSAEVLAPPVRERVERVFGKPLFDRYGNREAGAIAAECDAHRGLHVNEHDFLVEIDSPRPLDVPGPLRITYFANFAMPLIRYETGDLAVWSDGPCACGRSTRRLARIVGRQSDTIRTASGKRIHGEFFTHVLYGVAGIREFQFVQETATVYRLRLVGTAERRQEDVWRSKIMAMLDEGDQLHLDYVEAIPALSSGKRRFTLSLVDALRNTG